MPQTWTSKLTDVRLSNFIKVNLLNRSAFDYVDCLLQTPPSKLFSNEDLRLTIDLASVVHDMIMGSECSTYEDYGISGKTVPTASMLVGNISFGVKNATGKINKVDVPVLMVPTSCVEDKNKSVYLSGTKGFFSERGFMVVSGLDEQSIVDTLLHEFIHAMVATIPELKNQMYGEDDSVVAEEIVTHFVTNNFDKLQNLKKVKFDMKSIDIKPSDKYYTKFTQVYPDDIIVDGKSLVTATASIDAKDDAVKQYIKTKKGVYAL